MRAELRLTFLPAAACCWLAQGAVADEPADLHSFPSIVSAYEDLCIDRRSGDLRGLRLYA
ncbi:MAG: hypothetical protein U1E53_16380 [Dongiaceae bacterium]